MSRVIVPPAIIELDGAKVYILETTKRKWLDGRIHYIVSCFVEWKGKRSQTFDLDVTSNEELIAKLKTEIAKFKLMIMTGAFK